MLGEYFLHSVQDQPRAIDNFKQAVKLNPFEARYWLDLAAAYELGQEAKKSQEALERALHAEPTSPSIAWEAGTFYLAANQIDRALPLFRVAMEYDPKIIPAGLNLSWRATHSVGQMVNEAMPKQPGPYFAFLSLLMEQKQTTAANDLWQALVQQKLDYDVAQVFPYFDFLLDTKQIDQAEKVWKFLGTREPDLLKNAQGNLLSDGGFEDKFLNGAFGWRHRPRPETEVALDTSEFHSGTRSLRLSFTGPAISDTGVYQYIPVQPNTSYRLTAFVKSQDIVSASGPRLVVQDWYSNKMLASTEDLLGTTGWRDQNVDFTTGPDTRLVFIGVMRVPGNPLIKGTFWLDDLKLIRLPEP